MWYVSNELYHHGIKGQKWGVRRYQNPDGTRTEEGKLRYSYDVPGVKAELKQKKRDLRQTKRQKFENRDAKKEAIKNAKNEKYMAKGRIQIEKAKKSLDGKKYKIEKGHKKTLDSIFRDLGMSEENSRIAVKIVRKYENRSFGAGFAVGNSTGGGGTYYY